MKNCQKKVKYFKNWLFFILIIIFIFVPFGYLKAFIFLPNASVGKVSCKMPTGAGITDRMGAEGAIKKAISSGMEIKTIDTTVSGNITTLDCTDSRGFMERKMDQLKSWADITAKQMLKEARGASFKAKYVHF